MNDFHTIFLGYTILDLFLFAYDILTICSDDEEGRRGEDLPELEIGLSNFIVVDNLLVVPPEKFDKLENVIRKICSQIGEIKENGLWMPLNPESKKTYGYCFIEYNTPQVVYLLVVFSS
jgi:translation initiation factor 3 subunit B